MRSISERFDGSPQMEAKLKWATFIAAAACVAWLCVPILRPFGSVIAWSGVLAILCAPLQERLVRRTGRPGLSALITSVVTVLAVVMPLLVLGAIAINQGIAVAHSLQALWILRVPSAALWGVVTMFASVLPVVGAFAVWGPATLYLALSGAWFHAIVLAAWGTCVVSGIDNVLRPRLVAGRVGLSELSMFFALLGGLSVFGAVGIVLGPVVCATAAAMVEILREPGSASIYNRASIHVHHGRRPPRAV